MRISFYSAKTALLDRQLINKTRDRVMGDRITPQIIEKIIILSKPEAII